MQKSASKALILLAALISAAVTFGVYLPSLENGFVNWDDHLYVTDNPYIRVLDLKWAFTAVVGDHWLPLTLLSFTLDHAIWGMDPFGFHLTNSILHSANTALVAILAARLAGTREGFRIKGLFVIALASGLLFGVHPLRVESVAWITERKDVLNALFFLLSLHAYLSYAKSPSRPSYYYFLTLFFFILSLLSKPMTITMPLLLLIIDFYPLGRVRTKGLKHLVIEKLPFFGLSFMVGVLSILTQSGTLVPIEKMPLADRLHIASRGALFYIYKTFVPLSLAPLYPRDFESGLNLYFAAYALLLASITAFTVLMLKRTGALLSAWAYYLVTLLPVIGILQLGKQAAADRYMYIPGIGLAVLAAAGAGYLVRRNEKAFAPMLAAVAVTSALLSFLTVRQISVWKDSVSLWTQEIKVFPDYANGYVGRGITHLLNGNSREAAADLTKGIELKPGSKLLFNAYFHRGIAFSSIGRIPEGVADFTKALDLEPENGDYRPVYQNRAAAYMKSGEYALALEDLRKAASLPPVDAESYTKLGLAYAQAGDRENAYISLRKAVELGDNAAVEHLRALEGN